MLKQMKWEEVYGFWQRGCLGFSKELTDPVSAETVLIEYKSNDHNGYIYGYDWLSASEAHERKQSIQKNPMEFLYFSDSTNKGTIQTAEMLIESHGEEELAAIWIAATAKELERYLGTDVGRYASVLHMAACEFLSNRFYLWHHAMKKLVPEIMIPRSVIESMECKDASPVIGLIQMNTIMLKSSWCILQYSSLQDTGGITSSVRRL